VRACFPRGREKLHPGQRPKKPIERYARRVGMDEIEKEGYNLNISRYISTAVQEAEIDLAATHDALVGIENAIQKATIKHNEFLKELGLSPLPRPDSDSPKE
jgi:type I restriction enzyme M protein